MRKRWRLRLVFSLLLASAATQAADPPAPPGNDELRDQLVALERASWVAWQGHDSAFFARFLSDDHVDVGPRGVTDKASVVAGVASPLCKVESYAVGEFRMIRLDADSATLVYRAEQQTRCGGFAVPSPAWVTSVYARRGGAWTNVLFQQTPIESKP